MAGTHKPNNVLFSSDVSSPGYIEAIASSKSKTKETLRTEELIPSEILENSGGVQILLEAYYRFMNLEEFVYQQTETYTDVVLDNKAVFRVSDPRNENDHFFTDDDGANSVLTLTDSDGTVTQYTAQLNASNVNITNGNNLPGSLANSTSDIGKTFTVRFKTPNQSGYVNYNTQTATLTTPIKFWAGPGASYALNTIEESMDIDRTAATYLELIQKEIAAVVPRSIQVNKRNLYKAITDYYKIRGSSDSIEVFFRLLFDDEVEVEYPWDETLIPSSGNWEVNPALPKGGIYLDKKGFLSDTIKVQDSLRYQKFSYLIRTGQNLSSWDYFFNRLVHPAGFKYFAEILIQLFATRDELGDDQKILRELRYVGGPKHNQLTGESYFGYGRTNRFTFSSMPDLQPGVIGLEDIPLLVEMFASLFIPYTSVSVHKSGRLSLTVPQTGASAGTVTAVEIAESGFGYSTAPTIVVNGVAGTGLSISQATVTCTIDSDGKINSATVTSAGANYSSAFANVAGNPNLSKIAEINVAPDTTKKYSTPPLIQFDAPTSVNSFGVPLSSNITALGKYVLQPTTVSRIEMISGGSNYTSQPAVSISGGNGSGATAISYIENGRVSHIDIINPGSGFTEVPTIAIVGNATARAQLTPSEIASASIINPGFGYVITPNVYIASRIKNEDRVKSDKITRVLQLNHTDVDPVYSKVTNPVQAVASVRGRQLYNGKLLQKGVLTSGQNWTVTETTPSSDKFMGGYDVTVVAAGYRSIPGNDYYSQKTNILESNMRYDFNETLEVLGDIELQSTSINDINKYNVNSFIHSN
tara:strand:- start:487 stop:2922 length:2436 start_codon:yes stop_codon:yes gene_type:complete